MVVRKHAVKKIPCIRTRTDTDVSVIVPSKFANNFVWYNCHSYSPDDRGRDVADARQCWQMCDTYAWAGVVYDPIDLGRVSCTCYDYNDHPWYGTPATACLPGAWFIYNHDPYASAAVRRRSREKDIRSNAHSSLCPEGSSACNILDGSGLSYECIDTNQEIESCGGCTSGSFRPIDIPEESEAQDCTSIPGVALGGVTCLAGRCIISHCQTDHVLEENTCHPA
ncbi:uncharacterized protein IL334_003913 [Kwoniella shivajii]|uniref:Protein CPL1-like domain-containing protein n=1 Tax=Kwoniella shivajii TaxID=564305 RepID=A0ABZ1CYY4_9TREE|nr:hypothetical protein IL334_003913 [Kwoniella shivajii]